MIELNWTFFVQVINFLLLMFVLDKILYKPILKVLDDRDERIIGGQNKTKELVEQGNTVLKSYNVKIHDAKLSALKINNDVRKESVVQANEIIDQARKRSEEIISQVQQEMAQEISRVKKELEPELGVMASTIAQQIMGRKVA